jgi:broad specificity phosphatase PhoE
MEPLAERLGVPLREDQRLIEGHPPQAVLDLLVGGQSNVAVCTHGDIVAAIVEDLWRAGVIGRPAWAKGSTWVLEVHGGRITEARYLEP